MKLNADIIFDKLKEQYPAEMYGIKETALALSRPEFHMDDDTRFLAGHLYLATAEHLPSRPYLEKGAVLICIGEAKREDCSKIRRRGKPTNSALLESHYQSEHLQDIGMSRPICCYTSK